MEKIYNMQEQLGNVRRDGNTKNQKEMPEIKTL